ncbi:MAG TPA: 2OG-Fe(II) oxygenase [Pyrinomonadaceae bacterium]|nr:2OG-Fe(II) oxygenase [Pyrinomonadaceae bacterium]
MSFNENSAVAVTTPVVQVTTRGAVVGESEADFDALRNTFAQQHWLRLPNFLDASLLELIQLKLDESEYCVVDRETGVELRPVDCTAYLATELLLNSPKLFRAIQQLTGCAPIACFSGRIYRRPASSTYFNRWHTDITDEGRMIALSINLNAEPYAGGALQIRSAEMHELLCEVYNRGYGDALIFPVDEKFEHRVCEVEGGAAKTALAGWFRSKPDPNSLFGRGRQ